jgi:hypothetical protein
MLVRLLELLGMSFDVTIPVEDITVDIFDYNEYGDYLYPSWRVTFGTLEEWDEVIAKQEAMRVNSRDDLLSDDVDHIRRHHKRRQYLNSKPANKRCFYRTKARH